MAGRRVLAGPWPAVAAGLVVRLALLVAGDGTDRFRFEDSDQYLTVAGALPGALWSPEGAAVPASLARGPLYPVVAWVGGGAAHLTAVVLVQCVLAAVVNVVLAHRLAVRLGVRGEGGPMALAPPLAALAVAVDPATVGLSLLVATETLAATAVLCFALALEATVRRLRDGRDVAPAAAALGLAAGLAALVRPNLAVLVPWAALAVVLAVPRRRSIAIGAVAVAVALVPVGAWVVRNDDVGGAPVLSTTAGQNLVDFGLAAAAVERGRLDAWAPDRATFTAATEPLAGPLGVSAPIDGDTFSVATDARWRREGAGLLADHPRGAATVAGRGLVRAAAAPGDSSAIDQLGDPPSALRSLSRLAAAAWLWGLELLALVGVVALVRARRRSALVIALGTVLVVMASAVGPFLDARFRVPVWPLVAVLAGFGADTAAGAWRRRRRLAAP